MLMNEDEMWLLPNLKLYWRDDQVSHTVSGLLGKAPPKGDDGAQKYPLPSPRG